MDSRLVLVIEGDEPTAQRLAAAIREADYEVVVSNSARAGLDIAIEIKPDCVVCEVELPDEDGYWVARAIRTHASAVAVTPFLFLSGFDDPESRLEGFNVGADVYMTKPFEAEEVVGQVDALVKLASRLRQRRDSMLSAAPEQTYGSTAIEGDVRQMSIATVLSVLGMERRTGVFEVVSKKRRAQIEIAGGYVVHGTIGGTRVAALAAMRVMMSWKVGRFSFTPLPPCDAPPSLRTVQALLLDAAKAEDEEAATSVRSFGSVSLSSFGGPPSRPDDTGPPSSRALRDSQVPSSLAFDLVPSRRPEEMPAAEVSAAVDPAMAVFERAKAASTRPPADPAARPADSVTTRPPAGPAPRPPDSVTTRPPPGPAPRAAGKAPRAPVSVPRSPVSVPRAPASAASPTSVDVSISIDVEEVAISSDEDVISVRLDEVDQEWASVSERMLMEERTVTVAWSGREAGSSIPRHAPTPPTGTPIPGLRRTPAIVPPPAAGMDVGPLPAPPAAPRPEVTPGRKPAPEKGRAAPLSSRKKN
jgi:two-component system OmpR family response regulator